MGSVTIPMQKVGAVDAGGKSVETVWQAVSTMQSNLCVTGTTWTSIDERGRRGVDTGKCLTP
jgi:hypothetical protein